MQFVNEECTPFTRDWQLLSKALNPDMTGNKWRSVYADDRAFTNGEGFNDPGDPRADYVNSLDLTCKDPKFDKSYVCAGATLGGHDDGRFATVEILDGRGAAPTLEWLLAHPWLIYHAVTVREDGSIGRFPQGEGRPVIMPLIGTGVARYPLACLQRVPAIADPYVIGYRPTPY
jgi:hypothetical protein